ncbi:MAG: transcription-repair coupling factor [Candidatus Omnitrophota bacterium]
MRTKDTASRPVASWDLSARPDVRRAFEATTLHQGVFLSREQLLKTLTQLGYSRCERLGDEGDFSVRGEIIEIYPVSFEDPIQILFDEERIERIRGFRLLDHGILEEHPFFILLPYRKGERGFSAPKTYYHHGIPLQAAVDLEEGEYVVHLEYGIGRYRGLKKLRTESGSDDHLILEYADQDILYVPCDHIHLIQRYIGIGGRAPKLHRLGSKAWKKARTDSEKGILRYAVELLELQAKRSSHEGYAFLKDTDWQVEFEKAFPYRETPDQARSTLEVKQDMERPKAMDRLLCGDVGYGKTEVALRAAFKAVMNNKQVAILVPTTILAEQHYRTLRQRAASYPVRVEMLCRFCSAGQIKEILKALREGSADIVIGTHMLLSEKIHFKDLGMVVIDEEQRFGVRHKERLKRLRLEVDVLTLTATPIPRTLYLSLMGAKDISVINTPPEDRRPIETMVTEFDDAIIQQATRRELRRGGQVYFVTDRIKGIERIRDHLHELLPEARLAVCHGQMPEKSLEQVMCDFIDKKINFLVSTNIIESGIDIPSVNTLFINHAERFGLADLYQLRGRIGRFKETAYAYFFVPKGYLPTKEGEERLRVIRRFTALGSGFRIAMRDLEIRGAGNILGVEQHGCIQAIGFDLYLRLLREAIERLHRTEERP